MAIQSIEGAFEGDRSGNQSSYIQPNLYGEVLHFDSLPKARLNKILNNTPINANQGVLIKEIFKQKPRPLGHIGIIDIKLAYDIHPDANIEY